MAKRSGVSLQLSWIHFDATHPRADDMIAAADTWVAQRLPGVELSINENVVQTQALVKLVGDSQAFFDSLPGTVRNAVIRIYSEADHHEAVALVTAVAWTGPVSEG